MKYNPDIHHRRSIRLKGYDYSRQGLYFVTICTADRSHLFGKIADAGEGTMSCVLNEFGRIAEKEWIHTSKIRSNIRLHAYVVMPNHIHGIIEIVDRRGTMHRAPNMASVDRVPAIEQFGKPTSNTIPTIIRGYKSSVAKQINEIRQIQGVAVWQRNYYEHVIRDHESYLKIAEYIQTNPMKWREDRYYG